VLLVRVLALPKSILLQHALCHVRWQPTLLLQLLLVLPLLLLLLVLLLRWGCADKATGGVTAVAALDALGRPLPSMLLLGASCCTVLLLLQVLLHHSCIDISASLPICL
jgi:hypothetical protein